MSRHNCAVRCAVATHDTKLLTAFEMGSVGDVASFHSGRQIEISMIPFNTRAGQYIIWLLSAFWNVLFTRAVTIHTEIAHDNFPFGKGSATGCGTSSIHSNIFDDVDCMSHHYRRTINTKCNPIRIN